MTLEDIYLHRLADLHETEEQLIQSLLGSKLSIPPALREALQVKLQQTSAYRERLGEVLDTTRLRSAPSVVLQSRAENGHGGEPVGNARSSRNLWELTLASFLQTHGVKAGEQSEA